MKEELYRTKVNLRQLEHEFQCSKAQAQHLNRACIKLDHENWRQKDTIQSLQHTLTNMGHELQEYKTLSDIRGKELLASQVFTPNVKVIQPESIAINNEHESLLTALAVLDGMGATPVMEVVDTIRTLHKEIVKASNFLAENIRHSCHEVFQEELDRCYQDSERMIGARLSKFLHEHSKAEELSQPLIKITVQIFIVWFCASEWTPYLDQQQATLLGSTSSNTTQDHKERKAVFLRNLISIFKIAAWAIPGSAKRAAFEKSLNPFFKSLEKTDAAWNKIPEFTKVSLSFISPGEDLSDSETYEEDTTSHGIRSSTGQSPSQHIVLGTAALGVRCLFQKREQMPRTLLTAKVILEEALQYIFGTQEEQKTTTLSAQHTSQLGDGHDP